MKDYQNRKFTKPEIAGVTAALLMFVAIGMIMGGTAAGSNGVFYTGGGVFAVGAVIAIFLLIKYGKHAKDEDF